MRNEEELVGGLVGGYDRMKAGSPSLFWGLTTSWMDWVYISSVKKVLLSPSPSSMPQLS